MKSGKSTETRKSARINSYDYHAWDKFDVVRQEYINDLQQMMLLCTYVRVHDIIGASMRRQ